MSVKFSTPEEKQIAYAYLCMSELQHYRPDPSVSDGMGNLNSELNFTKEVDRYTQLWQAAENKHEYWVGCPDWKDRAALIFVIEAARLICGMEKKTAIGILKMAVKELENPGSLTINSLETEPLALPIKTMGRGKRAKTSTNNSSAVR